MGLDTAGSSQAFTTGDEVEETDVSDSSSSERSPNENMEDETESESESESSHSSCSRAGSWVDQSVTENLSSNLSAMLTRTDFSEMTKWRSAPPRALIHSAHATPDVVHAA